MKLSNLREYARSHLWVMPAVFLVGAFILSRLVLLVDDVTGYADAGDERVTRWYLFPGGPEGARELLSTIAASTFTFAGVVFSVTIVVLQLANNQLSPRVMGMFLRDIGTQVVLASLLATFLYSLLILREIQSADEPVVPAFSIWVAFILMVVNIGLFVYYIHHMTQRIRAGNVIRAIADETRSTIDRMYPELYEDGSAPSFHAHGTPRTVTRRGRAGVLTYIDKDGLENLARENEYFIGVIPAVGDFIPEDAPLMEVWTSAPEVDEEALNASVSLGQERTFQQDAAFGLRQLVDIAVRALSPSTNDPTTAVQALDQIHDLLRRLATRSIEGTYLSEDGRVLINEHGWDDYVLLGLDEIRRYGQQSPQLARRLLFALDDLLSVVPEERRAVVEEQKQLLDETILRSFPNERERELVRLRSAQGYGPPPGSHLRTAGKRQSNDTSY